MRLSAALVAIFAATASCLYEDQAGKVDWFRKNIGGVTHAAFHASGQQRLALVATSQSVVAALDLRSGELVWRQVLPPDETIKAFAQHGKVLVSVGVAGRGAFVRVWSTQGALIWDALLPGPAASADAIDASVVGASVVVAWGGVVTALDVNSGAVQWKEDFTAKGSTVELSLVLAPTTPGHVQAHGLSRAADGSASHLAVTLALANGAVIERQSLRPSRAAQPSAAGLVATLDRAHVASLDGGGASLLVHAVGSSQIAEPKLPPTLPAAPSHLLPLSLPGHVALRLVDGASALLKIGAAAKTLEVVRVVTGAHSLAVSTSKEGKAIVALLKEDAAADALRLETLAFDADGTHGEWAPEAESLPAERGSHGGVRAVWLNSYSRKDGSMGHRVLVSTEDDALRLLQPAKEGARAGWTREEGLATILPGSQMLPLPMEVVEAPEGGRPFFGFALPAVVAGIQRRLAAFGADDEAVAAAAAAKTAAAGGARYGDAHGFSQVLVARTGASKLFGVHTRSSEILWGHFVPPAAAGAALPSLDAHFVMRNGGEAGGSHVLVIARDDGGSYRLRSLHPFTGALLDEETVTGAPLLHAAKLPFTDGTGRSLVLLVDTSLKATVYPRGDAAAAALAERLNSVFFYVLRKEAATLTGYGLAKSGGAAVGVERWSMQLPRGPGGRPLDVTLASWPAEAAIDKPVRQLGDRTVLYKYLNPNLIGVGIVAPADGNTDGHVQALLIDAASGRVVHDARHAGCDGPLTMVLGENWVVYEYWSPALLQHQVTVSELFTNATHTGAAADDVLSLILAGRVDYTDPANHFDSFSAAAATPHVLTQTYAFGAAVAAMAVTQTAAGIAPKYVMHLTASGMLMSMDKRMLDPRRPLVNPKSMSAADREEGLVPYSPSLGGVNPLLVASHRNTIARPRALLCAPATLESTSLVAAVGLDLYLTRVAPAREFDRLNEDFNYVALLGSIVVLVVASWGTQWMIKRRELNRAWK